MIGSVISYRMGDVIAIQVRMANDMSTPSDLGKAVTMAGDFATNGRDAIGILLQNVSSGQVATVGVHGILPYFVRNVVSAGYALTITGTGEVIAAAAETVIVGQHLGQQNTDNANTSSGQLANGFFNFATGPFLNADSAGPLV